MLQDRMVVRMTIDTGKDDIYRPMIAQAIAWICFASCVVCWAWIAVMSHDEIPGGSPFS